MAESELVRELSARVLAQDDKVPTTIRINRRTLKRLRTQEKRWSTTMSFIVERALDPVLTELEQAKCHPTETVLMTNKYEAVEVTAHQAWFLADYLRAGSYPWMLAITAPYVDPGGAGSVQGALSRRTGRGRRC